MKTTIAKEDDLARAWFLVDATEKPAGRLATRIAHILRGKNKPTFTPHVDTGDFVVVINAEKVKLTGAKDEKKIYKNFSGYPGGLQLRTAETIRAKNPTRILSQAVKGMLPRNRLSRQLITRLKVYAGPEHPHAAQQPKPLSII
ncbi:MAG: 50S ribosomal protein L13 [bacterium]